MGKVSVPSPGLQYDPSRILVGSVLASPALILLSISSHPERYEVERIGENVECGLPRVHLIVAEGAIVRHSRGFGHKWHLACTRSQ